MPDATNPSPTPASEPSEGAPEDDLADDVADDLVVENGPDGAAPAAASRPVVAAAPFQPGPALWGMAVLAGLFLISAGVFVGTLLDGSRSSEEAPRASTPSQVDVGFLRDMQAHHAQAVEMAVLIRDRTDDEEIRQVALDIELTQQQQIGQMYGLLASWGKSQSNPNPMSWMSTTNAADQADDADDPHAAMSDMPSSSEGAGSSMPGMASATDLERLASLRGIAAERVFLELMIAHHQGGIPMATAAAADAEEPWVRTLAQSIVDAQSAEITALRTMLDDRGGPTR